jgi:hypothetical protein
MAQQGARPADPTMGFGEQPERVPHRTEASERPGIFRAHVVAAEGPGELPPVADSPIDTAPLRDRFGTAGD